MKNKFNNGFHLFKFNILWGIFDFEIRCLVLDYCIYFVGTNGIDIKLKRLEKIHFKGYKGEKKYYQDYELYLLNNIVKTKRRQVKNSSPLKIYVQINYIKLVSMGFSHCYCSNSVGIVCIAD